MTTEERKAEHAALVEENKRLKAELEAERRLGVILRAIEAEQNRLMPKSCATSARLV